MSPQRNRWMIRIIFWYISNKMQRYTVYLFLENCSTCFGWYLHPSSGAHTTVSTASGTCHTVMDRNKDKILKIRMALWKSRCEQPSHRWRDSKTHFLWGHKACYRNARCCHLHFGTMHLQLKTMHTYWSSSSNSKVKFGDKNPRASSFWKYYSSDSSYEAKPQ